MEERETIDGVLVDFKEDILIISQEATPDPKSNFHYTHEALTFKSACKGKMHVFETESAPRALCQVLSYRCGHE